MTRLLHIALPALLASLVACSTTIDGEGLGSGGDDGFSLVDAGSGEEADPEDDEPTGPSTEEKQFQVRIEPTELSLDVDEEFQLTAVIVDEDGNDAGAQPVRWLSADPSVAIVDAAGLVTALAEGQVMIQASIEDATAELPLEVEKVSCTQGEGNNGDSCADIYQGSDIWRCTVSPNLGGDTVSQVCRDNGDGPKWITFHVSPTDCCSCDGDFDVGCCAPNSGSVGCP
mgnify:CR=1 FL=1